MIKTLVSFWQQLSQLGVNNAMPFYLAQKRVVFNQTIAGIIIVATLHLLFNLFIPQVHWPLILVPALVVCAGVGSLVFMYKKRFSYAVTLLFTAFPVLGTCYVVATGMTVLYLTNFIFLVLAFYLLRPRWSTAWASAFILACFMVGYGFHVQTWEAWNTKFLFYAACLFVLAFIVLHGIRNQVCRYEASLKANNIHLHQISQKTQRQKAALERQAAQLAQQTATLTELNEVKTRLFSILSHDLRGHVHAIHGAIKVGTESAAGRTFLMSNLNELQKDATDACNLLEGILGWSKTLLYSAQPVIDTVDMHHLVQAVLKFYEATANKKGVFFQMEMDRRLTAACDRNMMETVFRNIVNNAIKFSEPGSAITVKGTQKNNMVSISIADQGKGMQQQELDRILHAALTNEEMSFSTGGIGLVLTKELLQKNHGCLHIQSKPGRGTKVDVELPLEASINNHLAPICAN